MEAKGEKIMEEKNICELSDEALGKVAGGSGNAGRYVYAGNDVKVYHSIHDIRTTCSMGILNKGNPAPYLGEDRNVSGVWYYHIKFQGDTGWVSSQECIIRAN